MIAARLIDLDGQTVMTDFVVESPAPPHFLRARLRRHDPIAGPADIRASEPVPFHTDTFVLERVLGAEDGGPLAIYRRRL